MTDVQAKGGVKVVDADGVVWEVIAVDPGSGYAVLERIKRELKFARAEQIGSEAFRPYRYADATSEGIA